MDGNHFIWLAGKHFNYHYGQPCFECVCVCACKVHALTNAMQMKRRIKIDDGQMKTRKEEDERKKSDVASLFCRRQRPNVWVVWGWYQSVLIKLIRFLTVALAHTHTHIMNFIEANWKRIDYMFKTSILSFSLNGRFVLPVKLFLYSHIKFICSKLTAARERAKKRVSHKDNKQQINVLKGILIFTLIVK